LTININIFFILRKQLFQNKGGFNAGGAFIIVRLAENRDLVLFSFKTFDIVVLV